MLYRFKRNTEWEKVYWQCKEWLYTPQEAVEFLTKENDMTKKPAKLTKSLSQAELQYAGELLNQAEEPQRNGTAAAQVMKRLINERLDRMTFLELALTLAHVMEKK